MIKQRLTREEKEIMKAIERNEFVTVTGKDLKDVADAVAARKKDATLTVRVNSHDINRIKRLAKKKGIRYQTYISEIIHRVAQSL
jgi:predicted DNA binding CopG/RHH family protein